MIVAVDALTTKIPGVDEDRAHLHPAAKTSFAGKFGNRKQPNVDQDQLVQACVGCPMEVTYCEVHWSIMVLIIDLCPQLERVWLGPDPRQLEGPRILRVQDDSIKVSYKRVGCSRGVAHLHRRTAAPAVHTGAQAPKPAGGSSGSAMKAVQKAGRWSVKND